MPPRPQPLRPTFRGSSRTSRLGEYAVSDIAFTKLTVLDTLEGMLVETGRVLDSKSRRLKFARVSLTAGAVLTAVELIVG